MQIERKPIWVSSEDAQRLFGLSRTTLWRLAKSGEIKSVTIGRAVRLNYESLINYFEREANGSAK